MLPDQGCYEERYRLTGPVAWSLALTLVPLVPAVLGSPPIGWLILSLAAFAAGATRPITTWRLDRDRLAALTAAVAPGIPIVDASTDPDPSVEVADQGRSVPELGPAD
jgi:hypothetical protein